jgi:hypothetical protein
MKRLFPLFLCAVLAALLVAEAAPATVTVAVQNNQGMGLRMDYATGTATQVGNSPLFRGSSRNQAGTADNPTTGLANKIWLQFDLSSVWATYGQANLTSATITLWGENGNTRRFDVAGLTDGLQYEDDNGDPIGSYEDWQSSTLTWNNAPGNATYNGYTFLNSTLLYQRTSSAVLPDATSLPLPAGSTLGSNYDQCARYISGDISAFLATDSDGKVTLMMGDGVFSDNSTWWYGPAGSYDVSSTYMSANGVDVLRDSPTLTLTFVPEPATMAILGLGGLFLRRRLA